MANISIGNFKKKINGKNSFEKNVIRKNLPTVYYVFVCQLNEIKKHMTS